MSRPPHGADASGGPDARTDAPVRGVELPPPLQIVRRATPPPARSVVRALARVYGSTTAEQRPLPDYLIIGAKKAGTSSLTNWLLQHPDIMRMFPPFLRLKSAHFFDINFSRGVRWYRGHFPSERARARHPSKSPIVGEASPYYLFHPGAPPRAALVAPHAKILVVLRNPVSRAYSNYWDRVAAGHETLPTFEAALQAEYSRSSEIQGDRLVIDPDYYSYEHDHHTYVARGRYLEQLQRWVDHFDAEQILVLCAEEMYREPARVFAEVEDFLEIAACPDIDFRTYNERSNPPLREDTRQALAAYFRPYNEALYEFLDRDLGWERTVR